MLIDTSAVSKAANGPWRIQRSPEIGAQSRPVTRRQRPRPSSWFFSALYSRRQASGLGTKSSLGTGHNAQVILQRLKRELYSMGFSKYTKYSNQAKASLSPDSRLEAFKSCPRARTFCSTQPAWGQNGRGGVTVTRSVQCFSLWKLPSAASCDVFRELRVTVQCNVSPSSHLPNLIPLGIFHAAFTNKKYKWAVSAYAISSIRTFR